MKKHPPRKRAATSAREQLRRVLAELTGKRRASTNRSKCTDATAVRKPRQHPPNKLAGTGAPTPLCHVPWHTNAPAEHDLLEQFRWRVAELTDSRIDAERSETDYGISPCKDSIFSGKRADFKKLWNSWMAELRGVIKEYFMRAYRGYKHMSKSQELQPDAATRARHTLQDLVQQSAYFTRLQDEEAERRHIVDYLVNGLVEGLQPYPIDGKLRDWHSWANICDAPNDGSAILVRLRMEFDQKVQRTVDELGERAALKLSHCGKPEGSSGRKRARPTLRDLEEYKRRDRRTAPSIRDVGLRLIRWIRRGRAANIDGDEAAGELAERELRREGLTTNEIYHLFSGDWLNVPTAHAAALIIHNRRPDLKISTIERFFRKVAKRKRKHSPAPAKAALEINTEGL